MAAHIRVLVAEDDPAARHLLKEALPRLPGLSLCGVAADGLECLALMDQLRPDAVLLDLVMPGLDGLGVLRAMGRRREGPVVVVTSQISHQGVVGCALSLGASYYLVKPVNVEALPELLQFLCGAPWSGGLWRCWPPWEPAVWAWRPPPGPPWSCISGQTPC